MPFRTFWAILKTTAKISAEYKTNEVQSMTEKELKRQYKNKKQEAKNKYRLEKQNAKTDYANGMEKVLNERKKSGVIDPPKRALLEEIGNAVTHGVGAVFAVVALLLMLFSSKSAVHTVAACIYFFGAFIAFSMSCLYHAFPHGSAVKRLFRRFDYCSIYLLIGATFAPLLLAYVGGMYGLIFLIVQWTVIATGITFIGVFGPTKLRGLHIALYLILGWSALIFMPTMLTNDLAFFLFILAGGVVYTLGIIPFALKSKVSHFIWHFFVLAGAIVQWLGLYLYLYL